jgi:peptidoglycan-associated lipoprotein
MKIASTLPVAAMALALAACSTTKAAEVAQPDTAKTLEASAGDKANAAQVTAVSDPKAEGSAALATALQDLQTVSVFFRTDDDSLSDEAKEKLATVGALLAKYPHLRVRVEGNCDERGTPAHNLALGQRRAESARTYLKSMGALEAQLNAVSLSNLQPKVSGHGEDAWQQNRRDDVVALDSHD